MKENLSLLKNLGEQYRIGMKDTSLGLVLHVSPNPFTIAKTEISSKLIQSNFLDKSHFPHVNFDIILTP